MFTILITAMVAACAACGSPREQTALSAQTTQLPTRTLDEVLAPVALYPDALLAQILMSAQDAPKVAELDTWLKANSSLKGTEVQDAAVKAGFDASFVALAVFPQVVAKMAEQLAWTVVLGEHFTKDKSAVFATIQKLRKQAQTVGTLKSNAQQEVETKTTSSGEQVIVIEPTNPQVIYVPQYNTQVVYTQPPTTTVVVQEDDDSSEAIAAGLIGFTAGIAIGAAVNNNYYYGPHGFYGGAYMYNDAWDDYYDHREDAREDWADHREDLSEERTDRRENTQEQRTDRQENRQESGRQATQAQKDQARQNSQTRQANRSGSAESRGYGEGSRTTQSAQRSSSGRSDAFSGYSSGSSQRASSSRGASSRSSASRGGASRGGGGRRR